MLFSVVLFLIHWLPSILTRSTAGSSPVPLPCSAIPLHARDTADAWSSACLCVNVGYPSSLFLCHPHCCHHHPKPRPATVQFPSRHAAAGECVESAGSFVPAPHLLCQVTMGKWPLSEFVSPSEEVACPLLRGLFSQSFGYCTQTFVPWVLYPALVTASKARCSPACHGALQAAGGGGCHAARARGSRDGSWHSWGECVWPVRT